MEVHRVQAVWDDFRHLLKKKNNYVLDQSIESDLHLLERDSGKARFKKIHYKIMIFSSSPQNALQFY